MTELRREELYDLYSLTNIMWLMRSRRFRLGGRLIKSGYYELIMQGTTKQWQSLVNILQEADVSLYVRRFLNSQSAIRLRTETVWDITIV
jgi:hypothetical protein